MRTAVVLLYRYCIGILKVYFAFFLQKIIDSRHFTIFVDYPSVQLVEPTTDAIPRVHYSVINMEGLPFTTVNFENFLMTFEDFKFVNFLVATVGLASIIVTFKKVPRTKGVNVVNHIIYFTLVALTLGFAPESIQDALFSQIGVLVIGTVVPVYESIKAVVSIDDVDDVAWLQFWIVSGEYSDQK